ncbi:glutathione synthase [Gloeocapsa sp. PCC 73106]|uniref:glutathione synthase n=1 Tax=Gloeocapsa sp. PCC 73106 TaxID=102232 RepID=UPI0002AC99E8|nr:glutathione synthase [Gloeocapsa sp. PCC 73106]ELR97656.1 glutathione synthetase [Gloeocapsa sp. PCC 73106]
MKITFIVDPISRLDPAHDTSVALMEAAQNLGHQVWITEVQQLTVIGGEAWAQLYPVELKPVTLDGDKYLVPSPWYQIKPGKMTPLGEMDAVFMRKDPPVTVPYLYATYILDLVKPPTLVLNSSQGIRTANEKMYALQFSQVIPETIVTQDKSVIREFVENKGAAVLKPLGGKAGEGILFLSEGDRNLNSLVEISTKQGQEPIMVQMYLPEAQQGDKRIILLNGEPIGAVNRVPTGKEFRGNMAVGGRVEKTEITPRELAVCEYVGPKLRADGLYFVGLDVIGGYLTEVNVTSPTGVREIDRLNQTKLGEQVIDWLCRYSR